MGIIVRQSIFNSIITYIGIGLGFILTVLLYPHILDPEQYGLTRVLISASLIFSQFAHLGFQNLVLRYYPFFKEASEKNHGFLFWVITVPLVGFALFSILFFLFDDLLVKFYSDRSPLFVSYYLWILPLTLFILYFEVLNNYLRSLRDSTTGSFVNEVSQRLFAILFLGLYFFEWITFPQFVLLFVVSYASQPLLILVQIFRKGEFQIRPNFEILRKPLVRGMANYSLYSLLGGLTTVLVWNVDILMLGSMAGLESTAIYAIAFYIGSVIAVPQRSIEKIAGPLISDFIKKKDWKGVGEIYVKTSLNQLLLGLLIFGLIWSAIDELFMLLPEVYSAGKWVVFIIAIGKLIEVGSGANSVILLNSKHYRVSFYTNIILVLITVAANYILIPMYGIEGAAIASALALFVYNCVKYLYIRFKIGLGLFKLNTLIVLVLGVAALYISSDLQPFSNFWIDTPLRMILFLTLFLFPALYFKLSPDLNKLISNLFKVKQDESTSG